MPDARTGSRTPAPRVLDKLSVRAPVRSPVQGRQYEAEDASSAFSFCLTVSRLQIQQHLSLDAGEVFTMSRNTTDRKAFEFVE